MAAPIESVQCFGRKKTAVAVTYCKRGRGLIKINGCPIELVEPEILRFKAYEPILLLGRHRFSGVDMRIRVKGGGHTSQIYAIRQSIAKALVAFYQKYVDEQSKKEIKDILVRYDRTLLVADPRRCEPKKFGGRGARARFQKSYRWIKYAFWNRLRDAGFLFRFFFLCFWIYNPFLCLTLLSVLSLIRFCLNGLDSFAIILFGIGMLLVNWKPGFRRAVWMNVLSVLSKLCHTPWFFVLIFSFSHFLIFANPRVLGGLVLWLSC